MRFKHYLLITTASIMLVVVLVVYVQRETQAVIKEEFSTMMDTVRSQQKQITTYQQENDALHKKVEIRDSLIVQQKTMLQQQSQMLEQQKIVNKRYEGNLDSLRSLFRDLRKSTLPDRYRSADPG